MGLVTMTSLIMSELSFIFGNSSLLHNGITIDIAIVSP